MKPNFALSLSFEGIRLLHRAAGGWRVVGDVALDAGDLAAELATLRRTATGLEPGGLRSKLIIPNAQIKYLTIPTNGMDSAALQDAARSALQGATPYDVADLAFDISTDGDETHIAAVARETLEEAENFAVEHRFHPVSFVATPPDNAFAGEPYFGPAAAAAELLETGEEITPDTDAVIIIGDAELPQPQALPEPEPESTAPTPAAEKPSADQPAAAAPPSDAPKSADPAPEPKTEAEAEAEAEATPAPKPEATPEPKAEEKPKPVPADAGPVLAAPAKAAQTEAAPAVVIPKKETLGPPPGFTTRRIEGAQTAKPLTGAQRGTDPAATPKVTLTKIAPIAPEPPKKPNAQSAEPSQPGKPKLGFLSRRKAAPKPQPEPQAKTTPAGDEAAQMTVFGARDSAHVGGKPRFLGLIMTVVLLVFLAGVAAWASVFMDDGLARFFGDRSPNAVASAPASAPASDLPAPRVIPADPEEDMQIAALDPGLTEEDGAVLDALRAPLAPEPETLTPEALEARYAVTGIWPLAPDLAAPPAPISLDDFYITSIDPVSTSNDAVALPSTKSIRTDVSLASLSSPAAAGTQFALDAQGLVRPTAAGTLTPDGFTVFLGAPPAKPPATPTRFEETPVPNNPSLGLAVYRPSTRPEDLAEQTERAQLNGQTRDELSQSRPELRPQSIQQIAQAAEAAEAALAAQATAAAQEAAEAALAAAAEAAVPKTVDPFEGATRFAAAQSRRPDTRPRNFARIVKRAERAQQQAAPAAQTASAASVAPRTVSPAYPSKTSVAKQATVRNAINLSRVNLIGVYGKPSNRRALVRLSNGRYRKVVVGDQLDGGRVSAIGDSELRYTKRGRNYALQMPKG
ncbi:MAG: hypothetical protein ACSHWZ_05750 [Sulfitobacter sp.]